MATASSVPRLILHTSYTSSSAARVRLALKLKNITSVEEVYINLGGGQQLSDAHRALNPRMSVPVLQDTQHGQDFPIIQSVAALEYLEEVFPAPENRALLPPPAHPLARAKVRTLVNLIVADMQPLQQIRVTKRIAELGGEAAKTGWVEEFTKKAFEAIEQTLKRTAGRYSVGDKVTLADCCLVPAVWNAEKLGLDLEPYPRTIQVFQHLEALNEVRECHWRRQPDTPEDLKIAE
jgi:maleylacetoacetate isomerase